MRSAEGTGKQHWEAHGPGILECDSGEGALERPSWAGSPRLGSCRAETGRLGRLESPGGNPGRPCGPGGCAEAVCRLAPPDYEWSKDPEARRPPLPGLRRLRLSRAGPGSFPTPMSHLGGSGMHQETPGLLPFLRGGAPRLGLFLPALLPPPAGCLGSSSSRPARSGPQVSPSLPYRSPACRLLLRSPQQRKPGFAWWAPPVKPAGRGWRLSSTLPGSPASRVFPGLGDLC